MTREMKSIFLKTQCDMTSHRIEEYRSQTSANFYSNMLYMFKKVNELLLD